MEEKRERRNKGGGKTLADFKWEDWLSVVGTSLGVPPAAEEAQWQDGKGWDHLCSGIERLVSADLEIESPWPNNLGCLPWDAYRTAGWPLT